MPASLTPKIGFSYNYGLGENGWKPGYDENWIRADSLIISAFGYNRATTVGLTYGYLGGYLLINGALTSAASGTVVLPDNTTRYVERDPITGVVSSAPTKFTVGRLPMAVVVTLGGAITSVTDARSIDLFIATDGVDPHAYGAVGDGVHDDTANIIAAYAAAIANNTKKVILKTGFTYLVTNNLAFGTQAALVGQSEGRAFILYRPGAAGTCITFSAGAAIAYYCKLENITIYSDDLTYVKCAVDLKDVSSATVRNINIFGVGAGLANFWDDTATGSSIGIRTFGREASVFDNIKIAANYPVYWDQNPNTVPNAGEDSDHMTWTNCYLIAKGHYCYTMKTGLGATNLVIRGYQALVGGLGGVFINDTRAAPTIPSRNISICDFRCEQATSAAGFGINLNFTFACQQINIENGLTDANIQGLSIVGFNFCNIKNVTTARGSGSALTVGGIAGGLRLEGFYAQLGSTNTLPGRLLIDYFDSSLYSTPNYATYGSTRTGSVVDMDSGFFGAALCAPTASGGSAARQAANSIWHGVGVPNNAVGANGDVYFRADGGVGTNVYKRAAGAWGAIL